MIDIQTTRVGDGFKFGVGDSPRRVERELTHVINDIAEQLEQRASMFAPVGETGDLSNRGVIRTFAESSFIGGSGGVPGSQVTEFPAIGGGFTVRGGNRANRGQFSSATKRFSPGHIFDGIYGHANVAAQVYLNPGVKYGKWVHNGTGIYGPKGRLITPKTKPFMVFTYFGRKWVVRTVKGQRPQPFLTQAFEYVNDVYTPVRMAQLRAEIGAL